MRNILLGLGLLAMFGINADAEMFTKEKRAFNYSLETEKPVDFKLDFSSAVDKDYIGCDVRVSVTNSDKKLLMNGFFKMKDGSATLHFPTKSGKYNLKIDYHSGTQCWNKPFDLKLTRVSGNFEQEYNNDMKNATLMKELSYFYGYLQTSLDYGLNSKEDVDFYKIVLPQNGSLRIVFSHKNYNKKYVSVKLELIDSSGKSISKYENYLDTEGEDKSFNLDKGTYFFKVIRINNSSNIQHMPYKVAYSFSEKK